MPTARFKARNAWSRRARRTICEALLGSQGYSHFLTLVLDLQLRSLSKSSNAPVNIHSISDLANLSDWLVKIEQLGKTKPYHNVVYSRPFPDIDDLMQAWDSPIEKALEHTALPPADVDLTLDEYTRMVAALLDIPVNESKVPIHENGFKESNLIESLHCVFSLYSAFKESGHFKDLNNGYPADAIAKAVE
jgi:intraflagellar transport protein 46